MFIQNTNVSLVFHTVNRSSAVNSLHVERLFPHLPIDTYFHASINTDFHQNRGVSKSDVLVKTHFQYEYIFISKLMFAFLNSTVQSERMVLEISMLPFTGIAYTFDDVPGARVTS